MRLAQGELYARRSVVLKESDPSFIPLGAGPKSFIGASFVMLEMTVGLAPRPKGPVV
jgi:hypothetical protein